MFAVAPHSTGSVLSSSFGLKRPLNISSILISVSWCVSNEGFYLKSWPWITMSSTTTCYDYRP